MYIICTLSVGWAWVEGRGESHNGPPAGRSKSGLDSGRKTRWVFIAMIYTDS